MFKFIKGLFNKEEIARIKELELENESLQKELDSMTAHALDLFLQLNEKSDEERQEELDALEASREKCHCGGYILPMYDEYPDWIKFCNKCNACSEESDYSPILEP